MVAIGRSEFMLEVETAFDVPNHTLVVRLAGSADLQSSGTLHAALQAAMARSNDLVVDCSKLDFISSMSLSELISTRLEIRKRSGSFCLVGVSPMIRRLLARAKLETLLAVQS